jgi:DNA-binding NarL/FixJ family response regulator
VKLENRYTSMLLQPIQMKTVNFEATESANATQRLQYNVLLVDDHKILRDGIRAILNRSDEFLVVGEAETDVEAIQVCKRLLPDIVLMDISLLGTSGIVVAAELLRHCPETRVIVLSMHDDEHSVINAIRSGARGYVLKTASENDLLNALRTVAKGGSYLSPQVSDSLLNRIQRGDIESKPAPSVVEGLSPRELQVLRGVADGNTTKEIAVILELGLETVRSYRKSMMKKLKVNNAAGLTQLALKAGLTHLGDGLAKTD